MSSDLRASTAAATAASTAEDQARRMFFLAVARLRERVPPTKFGFLRDYQVDLPTLGADAWRGDLASPLHRLATTTGFDVPELVELFTVALVDEDARFGAVFEAYTGHPRPTLGLLHSWWPESRPTLRRMRSLGLLTTVPGAVSARTSACASASLVWDAVRGDAPRLEGRSGIAARRLPPVWTIWSFRATWQRRSSGSRRTGRRQGGRGGAPRPACLRPAHGRRRVAAELGRGVLEVDPGSELLASAGVLATVLGALPLFSLDPGPGQHCELPALVGGPGPVFVVMGRRGAVSGPDLRRAVTVDLGSPGRRSASGTGRRRCGAACRRPSSHGSTG